MLFPRFYSNQDELQRSDLSKGRAVSSHKAKVFCTVAIFVHGFIQDMVRSFTKMGFSEAEMLTKVIFFLRVLTQSAEDDEFNIVISTLVTVDKEGNEDLCNGMHMFRSFFTNDEDGKQFKKLLEDEFELAVDDSMMHEILFFIGFVIENIIKKVQSIMKDDSPSIQKLDDSFEDCVLDSLADISALYRSNKYV